MTCPPDDVLQNGLDGDARAHVQGCASCQARIDALVALAATLDSDKTFARAGPPDDVLAEGAAIGPYRVTRRLGAGAMGAVYAAYDARLEREVALKVLHRELGDLVGESRLLARLSHPNVVTVHEVLPWNDRFVLVMELARGLTLRQWLEASPRSLAAVLDVFRQCAAGLAAAHAAGIVHRDFKPDNVLVDDSGRARLLDFGLAMKLSGSGDAGFGGSPAYLGLAQLQGGPADAQSDQFAWWVSLYEALARRLPHEAPNFAALVEARRVQPVDLSPLPAWLRPHVARGLSNEPSARFPDLEAASRALTPPRRWKRAALATAAVALALVAGSVQLARPSPCREVTVAPDALLARVKDAVLREAVGEYAQALETCRALPSEEQPARAACLEQTGRELELAIAALEEAPDIAEALHPRVLRRVRPAARCAKTPLPQVTLPAEAERATLLESHRVQLRFDALRAAGDFDGSLALARSHTEAMAKTQVPGAKAWAQLNEASALVTKGQVREALGLLRAVESIPELGLRERAWGALGAWLLECYASPEEACRAQEKRALRLAGELDEPWSNAWRDEIGLRYLEAGPTAEEVIKAWSRLPGAGFESRRTLANELATVIGEDDRFRLRAARELAQAVGTLDARLQVYVWQIDSTLAMQEGDLARAREVVQQLEQAGDESYAQRARFEAKLSLLVSARRSSEALALIEETESRTVDPRTRYRVLLTRLWLAWFLRETKSAELERQVELVAPNFSSGERAYFDLMRALRALRTGDAKSLERLPTYPGEEVLRAWQLAVLRGDEAEEARLLALARGAEDVMHRRLQVVELLQEKRWAEAAKAGAAAREKTSSAGLESQLRLLEAWSRWQLGEKDTACRVMNLNVFLSELVPRELAWAKTLERECPRLGVSSLD